MRKVSSSLPFRAQGFLTLSVFAEEYLTLYKQQLYSTTSSSSNNSSDTNIGKYLLHSYIVQT